MDLLQHVKAPRTAEEAHAPAIAAGCLCHECSLYGCGRGPVLGQVVPNAVLNVIGEAPGRSEVEQGVSFCGASGVELDQSLAQGGVARSECTITNTILCQPPEDFDDYLEKLNREHRKACAEAEAKGLPPPHRKLSPIEACAPRLEREIQISNSKTILAVGGKALRAMAQRYKIAYGLGEDTNTRTTLASIKGQHGSPVQMPDGTILASSLHPAFAMRDNRQYTQIIRDNITRAASIAKRGNVINWTEPEFHYFEKWPNQDHAIQKIEELCAWFVAHKTEERVKCDIETDSIVVKTARVRCIGFGMRLQKRFITVPLLWMDGREFWSSLTYRLRAEAAIRRVLDECELTFHNGLYDTAILLEQGLMSDPKKRWVDTLLAHRNTDSNDLPHDLGFVVRQFTEAPLWKKDIDHKGGGGTTDAEYHLYNGHDVHGTAEIEEPLIERVVACGNVVQFRLDTALAPIARDMGRLGLFIDERERGDLSLKFNHITHGLTARIQGVVGRATFNPRSAPQVKDWLYGQKGYAPPLNTDGYEWEPGDDPSSSTPALMKLLDLGVDEQTDQMVNTLLEFRACDKLRGSYIDNLRVLYEHAPLGIRRTPSVVFDGAEILPERPEISWMPITWKIHVIPSGRWVCDPTIQNWPSRGWVVGGKPTNMRKMIIAPPGHVIVGADYEQIEARIFAVITNDRADLKAFRDGLELHCLTAATIMAERESEIEALYHEFVRKHLHGTKDEKSEMKYIRTVSKRVRYLKCVAEGELVLTDRGLVPIEDVTKLDKVWDGMEWVEHDGVIYQGEKEVIEHDGLRATPDHEVWTYSGEKMELEAAKALRRELAQTGSGREPIRFVRDDIDSVEERELPLRPGALHWLRNRAKSLLGQSEIEEVGWLSSLPLGTEVFSTGVAAWLYEQRSHALHESETSFMEALWRTWHQIQVRFNRSWSDLGHAESRPQTRILDRSDRQRWALRTRQPSLGYPQTEHSEYKSINDGRRLGLSRRGMAAFEAGCREEAARRYDEETDYRRGARVRSAEEKLVEARRKTVRVYDILNAGPRRRFTVSNVLVSNCYGGGEDKLFSAMASERDKATGKRVFPNLLPSRVAEWEDRWERRHSESAKFHRDIADFVRRNGYSASVYGSCRKRYFVGGPNKKNAPPNMVVQGSAGDIKNEAILRLHEKIPFGKWSRHTGLCMDIHDYLAAFVPENRADEAIAIFNKCMRTSMKTADGWDMPIFAEAKASKNLADNA